MHVSRVRQAQWEAERAAAARRSAALEAQVAHLQFEIRAAAAATATLAMTTPSPPPAPTKAPAVPRMDDTAKGCRHAGQHTGQFNATPRVLESALKRATAAAGDDGGDGLLSTPVEKREAAAEQGVARALFRADAAAQAKVSSVVSSPRSSWRGNGNGNGKQKHPTTTEEDDMCRVEGPSPLPTDAMRIAATPSPPHGGGGVTSARGNRVDESPCTPVTGTTTITTPMVAAAVDLDMTPEMQGRRRAARGIGHQHHHHNTQAVAEWGCGSEDSEAESDSAATCTDTHTTDSIGARSVAGSATSSTGGGGGAGGGVRRRHTAAAAEAAAEAAAIIDIEDVLRVSQVNMPSFPRSLKTVR